MKIPYFRYFDKSDPIVDGTFTILTEGSSSVEGDAILVQDCNYHSYQFTPTLGEHNGTFRIQVSNDGANWLTYYSTTYSSSSATPSLCDFQCDENYFYAYTSTDTWQKIAFERVVRDVGVANSVDYDDNFFYICIGGSLWGRIGIVDSSFFAAGSPGDTACATNYFYILTGSGWKEFPLVASDPQEKVDFAGTDILYSQQFYFKYARVKIDANTNGSFLINEIHGRF